MKINIKEQKENTVLKRSEIIADIDYESRATPSKAELQLAFSKQLNIPQDKIEISKIISETGLSKGTAWVKAWKEKTIELYGKPKEEMKEEPKQEKPEEKKEEEPKQEEKKEEPPKEEAPKEEKKEAPKEGEK